MTLKSKIKLVYKDPGSLNAEWMLPRVQELFDIELWDQNKTYDYKTTLALRHNNKDNYAPGLRTVIDNLWESSISSPHYVMQHPDWFWYNESLWYAHRGYNQYKPAKTYSKLALMPMRKKKPHRDYMLAQLQHRLNDLVWSYVESGQQLPNDVDMSNFQGQRHFDPNWYDQTYFSIVVETSVNSQPNSRLFITEKTYKPLAFQHPFVVYGNIGTLTQLKKLGFVTFDNLFDESYDSISNPIRRASAIIQCIDQFQREPYSAETQDKLAYNHAHFFDQLTVHALIKKHILEPLLHYAETT